MNSLSIHHIPNIISLIQYKLIYISIISQQVNLSTCNPIKKRLWKQALPCTWGRLTIWLSIKISAGGGKKQSFTFKHIIESRHYAEDAEEWRNCVRLFSPALWLLFVKNCSVKHGTITPTLSLVYYKAAQQLVPYSSAGWLSEHSTPEDLCPSHTIPLANHYHNHYHYHHIPTPYIVYSTGQGIQQRQRNAGKMYNPVWVQVKGTSCGKQKKFLLLIP